jgi:hypothetical protein
MHDPAGNYFDLSHQRLEHRADIYTDAAVWNQKHDRRIHHFTLRVVDPIARRHRDDEQKAVPGEAEQPREGQPGRPIGPVVHGAVERLRDLAARGVRHLLDAHHQSRIAQARGDRQHGVTEGNAAGGAGSLDLGAGYVLEPKLVGDDACQNLLPAQRSGDEVAEVQGAYLLALHASALERGVGRVDREALQSPAVVLPKGCRSHPGDRHVTHCRSPSGAAAGLS